MHRLSSTPSVVPDHDATVYVVLDDYGSAGQAYREIDPNDADEQSIVDDLISGQFERPIKIVAFNVVEGWCRDASEDIARRAVATAWKSGASHSRRSQVSFSRGTRARTRQARSSMPEEK